MEIINGILRFIVNTCIYIAVLILGVGLLSFLLKNGSIKATTPLHEGFVYFCVGLLVFAVSDKIFIKKKTNE